MPRFVPRHLLTDAALALVLIVLTVGPGLVMGFVARTNPDAAKEYVDKTALPGDRLWWVFAALIVFGLLIRQQHPPLALVLTGAGTFGHLFSDAKFQLLDLALPLVLYTVAAVARNRRVSFAVLALAMLLTYAAMVGGRIYVEQQEFAGKQVVQEQVEGASVKKVVKTAPPPAPVFSVDRLVNVGQAVMELWLLLVAAFAVGDAMRSRRAHLAAVEQRTADLAREERQRAALAVAAERARITRGLHDVVAHGISVMVVQAQGASAALDRHPDRAATALQHVITTGRASLAEMRRLLAAGRTDPAEDARLTPLPGLGAVPALIDQLRSTGMRIELHVDGVPAAVPATVDLSAYRIVQEALTNTLKHAGPGAGAVLRLAIEPGRLRVEVVDDGTGLADGADGRGNGLRGIAERVAMLGGELETGRADGGGFRLCATLPLQAREMTSVPR
ncbi:Histidine kinase-, DNA gyrase B-, and HSP90-like ATPase [Micromonospora rhizosphaerae]|uniref:histidine kinase n=1 Tax=Micromonospora rhizosphaerae TaxID=568872 RepID=A0A1C6SYX0_9ACTN|nr:sensor histidine kinase [Micromonospora rhizosphaerae]SCL34708.1 Histidine kinase-, DNA gyrase B-, and HSP90-like ATPase [Micromonospora rhizosphaerae]